MLLTVIFLPLVACVITFVMSRFINRRHVVLLHLFLMYFSLCIMSLIMVDALLAFVCCEVVLGVWLDIGYIYVN